MPPWVPQGNGLGRDLCQALQSVTLFKINTVHFITLFRKRYTDFFLRDPNSFYFAYRIQALLECDIIELMNTIFYKHYYRSSRPLTTNVHTLLKASSPERHPS